MKKIILVITLVLLLFSLNNNNYKDEFIRIRVIANSNSKYDQDVKMKVSNNLKTQLYDLLKGEKDINNARKTINKNLDKISENINRTIKDEKYSYKVNYGMNYFPEKEYNGKKYKEGNYESLLITLGKAEGDNWWCILFPPICLLEAEESSESVEYEFFLKKIIDKIIRK